MKDDEHDTHDEHAKECLYHELVCVGIIIRCLLENEFEFSNVQTRIQKMTRFFFSLKDATLLISDFG